MTRSNGLGPSPLVAAFVPPPGWSEVTAPGSYGYALVPRLTVRDPGGRNRWFVPDSAVRPAVS